MNKSSETQDRILDTAIRHFAKVGYHGTKTADIAKDSGVSEGTVFKYYSTKTDILRGAMSKIIHSIIPGIMFGPAEDFESMVDSPDPKGELKKRLEIRMEKVNQNIGAFKVLINEMQYHEDIMSEYTGQFVPKAIGMIEEYISLGISRGIFRQMDIHTIARSMVGMMAMIILEGNVLKKPIELDKELDIVLDIFFNGIYVRKEG
ncbi:MAG: TetR/AcrR family transcriptional regulator [Clostridiaceae bacterium]|nr:TetR/AcrR family transcriptional regulator [Clostridiaceae bacterium]